MEDQTEIKTELVERVIKELKNKRLLKENKNTYQNTETLLYKLDVLPKAICFLEEEIQKLEEESNKIPVAPTKSGRLILKDGNHTYTYGDETIKTRISELKQIVLKTNSYIRMVNKIIKRFETDEYYPIIDCIYFQRLTYNEIADQFGWAIGTISKHKSRLINEIKVYIFPNNFIEELGN